FTPRLTPSASPLADQSRPDDPRNTRGIRRPEPCSAAENSSQSACQEFRRFGVIQRHRGPQSEYSPQLDSRSARQPNERYTGSSPQSQPYSNATVPRRQVSTIPAFAQILNASPTKNQSA